MIAHPSGLAVILLSLLATSRLEADQFERCLLSLRNSRQARGITSSTWATLAGARPDSLVLAQLNSQPEFRLPIWDYVAVMVDQERIDDGKQMLEQYRDIFKNVSRQYGVDDEMVAAIWGIESNYGRGVGTFNVLTSLATLSCAGRRQRYFRGELISALRIVQAGHVRAEDFRGSWAGAFGQTQFMPGIFWGRAVDFDGDGRRDLMHSVGDALASAANYLRLAGAHSGVPWGLEVRLPRHDSITFDLSAEGRRIRRPLVLWARRGVLRVDGTPLVVMPRDSALRAGLFLPAGERGPVFLVTSNFEAVYRYNAATSYTLAILHLADRLRGGAPFVTPWPTDDLGLSRAERRELQRLLQATGHDIGVVDGLLSPKTRAAVIIEQRRLGQEASGRPGQRLLTSLRER